MFLEENMKNLFLFKAVKVTLITSQPAGSENRERKIQLRERD